MPSTNAANGLAAVVEVSATLGMSSPLLVLLISSTAEELGVVVPIPTFCCAYAMQGSKSTAIDIHKKFETDGRNPGR